MWGAKMESVKKIIRTNDARQTEFYFSRLNGDGFNNEQIQFLVELISKYLNKYKKLVINKVTDLYDEKEFFYTNESGEKYEDIPILGQYFWEAKKIRLNHIRVSRMPLNDTDFIRNIAARAQQVYEVENKIDHIKWTAMKKGIKYEDLQKEFERDPKMKDFILKEY